MMNKFSLRNQLRLKEMLRRIDHAAGNLNALLVVIAIGLFALDATFLLTLKVIDHLPPITRVSFDDLPK